MKKRKGGGGKAKKKTSWGGGISVRIFFWLVQGRWGKGFAGAKNVEGRCDWGVFGIKGNGLRGGGGVYDA